MCLGAKFDCRYTATLQAQYCTMISLKQFLFERLNFEIMCGRVLKFGCYWLPCRLGIYKNRCGKKEKQEAKENGEQKTFWEKLRLD